MSTSNSSEGRPLRSATGTGDDTGASPAATSLSTVPAHLVRRVHQRHARLWAEVVGEDPTPPQYAVLHVVGEEPGINLTDLGVRAALDRTTVGRVVDRLARDGWVDRRPSGDDRRRMAVMLTPAGRERHDRVTPQATEASQRLLAALTTDQADSLMTLLRVMLDNKTDQEARR